MSLRDRLAVSPRRQRQATWVVEMLMIGMLFIGVDRGSTTIIVNVLVGFAAIHVPSVLERDYGVVLEPALTLWIAAAVFLHAFGVVGLPGSERTLYASLPWWDHVTHALSASVVAGVGYTTVRAVQLHARDVYLPRRFVFVFILLFTLAFGVLWEVLEFFLGELARAVGNQALLTQHGLEDTLLDLVFDSIGAILVAVWGTVYLNSVSDAVGRWVFGGES